MSFVNSLHIVLVIGKYTGVFRGDYSGDGGGDWEEGFTREDLSTEEFTVGEVNFHEERARFSSIIKKKEKLNK